MRYVSIYDSDFPYPVNSAQYQACHRIVRNKYGKAREYECYECGGRASDWAWIHGTDPWDPDNYATLCRLCHQEYDRAEWLVEERRREFLRKSQTNAYKGWTPERREAQRQRMLAKWSVPGERERQAERARRDRPWEGRRPKRGGGAR